MLFTRDLRVHDRPALSEAAHVGKRVVPLSVLDDALIASGYARPNCLQLPVASLADLDGSLRARGGHLVVRRDDPAREAVAVTDCRLGARHFLDLLVDGDIASNSGNWQWVADTGSLTRPDRVFDPVRQARWFDRDSAYVRAGCRRSPR